MLSQDSFYVDDYGKAYVIGKMTDKTVLFTPVQSIRVSQKVITQFCTEITFKATREPDETRKPIRFRLKNQFNRVGTAKFYETKNGSIVGMYELESDTYIHTLDYD